jgi:hypothetical protein
MDYAEVSSKLKYNTDIPFEQLTSRIISANAANNIEPLERTGLTRLASWKYHAKKCEC